MRCKVVENGMFFGGKKAFFWRERIRGFGGNSLTVRGNEFGIWREYFDGARERVWHLAGIL